MYNYSMVHQAEILNISFALKDAEQYLADLGEFHSRYQQLIQDPDIASPKQNQFFRRKNGGCLDESLPFLILPEGTSIYGIKLREELENLQKTMRNHLVECLCEGSWHAYGRKPSFDAPLQPISPRLWQNLKPNFRNSSARLIVADYSTYFDIRVITQMFAEQTPAVATKKFTIKAAIIEFAKKHPKIVQNVQQKKCSKMDIAATIASEYHLVQKSVYGGMREDYSPFKTPDNR